MNLLDNIKKNKIGGLILCLALLFLFSCEDEDVTLGLPFDPNDENLRIFEKELTLSSSVVLIDSITTSPLRTNTGISRVRILSGSYQNEELGTVSATAFTNFSRASASIPADAVYDSAVLVLDAGYSYGITAAPAMSGLSVHLLEEPLIEFARVDTTNDGAIDSLYNYKTYYSEDEVPFSMASIGQATFRVDPDKESNEVHLMLNDDFGADLFTKFKSNNKAVANNEQLQLYFKGIALVSAQGTPHMLGFDQEATKIHIYHHTPSTDSLRFTLDTESANWFTHIEGNRSGTPLANLTEPLQDFNPGNGKIYVQSGTGIVTKIDFAPFIDFINSTGEKVVINQANFSIEIDFPGEFFPPLTGVQPYLVKNDNKLIIVVDRFGTPSIKTINDELINQNLVFQPDTVENTSTIVYKSSITRYAEMLLDGREEKDFLLYPNQIGTSINHLIADSSRIKLKLYYTTLK